MKEDIILYGQLLSNKSLEEIGLICDALQVQIKESSHYQNGRYLLVYNGADSRLTFEQVASNEFLIKGEADLEEALEQLAAKISKALASEKLKHRMELYDAEGGMYQYLNYNWGIKE